MSFSDLKKKRGTSGLSAIQEKLEALSEGETKNTRGQDDRLWKPTQGKDGVGSAIIRFLPTTEGDDQPWVELTEYAFQGPGGWYIEKSLTSIQRKDPVQDKFSELWQSGIEANKDKAKKLKRKFTYTANILVVRDPAHPENEGKVFLYKFGKRIFDKIRNAMFPEQDELDDQKKEGVNVFCPWEGSNFKLRVAKVEGYPNYDKSEFATSAQLFDGDETKIKNLWDSQYKLKELVAPDNFKTYDVLKARLDRVLGLTTGGNNSVGDNESPPAPTAFKKAPPVSVADVVDATTEADEESVDSDLSYLQQLASED